MSGFIHVFAPQHSLSLARVARPLTNRAMIPGLIRQVFHRQIPSRRSCACVLYGVA
jgi:hypothetical protein